MAIKPVERVGLCGATKPCQTAPAMVLQGDANTPNMALEAAHVNHLRRVLAWLVLEYGLDEEAHRDGTMPTLQKAVEIGLCSPERAQEYAREVAAKYARVPAYVRDGVKSLRKAIQAHESASGIVQSGD